MIAAVVLALLLSWQPPATLCAGAPIEYPEQLTYLVEYRVREMVVRAGCPPDDDGNLQACATYTGTGQWVTSSLSLDVSATADPPLGVVFDVQDPQACNPAGCNAECGS